MIRTAGFSLLEAAGPEGAAPAFASSAILARLDEHRKSCSVVRHELSARELMVYEPSKRAGERV